MIFQISSLLMLYINIKVLTLHRNYVSTIKSTTRACLLVGGSKVVRDKDISYEDCKGTTIS